MGTAGSVAEAFELHPDATDVPELEREVMLGEPDSTSTSITWIGYAEYEEEHRARASEFDQAASTRALPSNASPELMAAAPEPLLESAEAEEAAPPGLAMAEVAAEESPPVEPAPAVQGEQVPPPAEVLVATKLDPETAQRAVEQAGAALDATIAGAAEGIAEVARTFAAMTEPFLTAAREAGPPDPAPPTETPAEAEAAPAVEPQPEVAAAPASPLADPGILSDREAIAAAVKQAQTVTDWTKPVAGKGLRVTTVRPRMAVSTQMVASGAADPVVRLWFGSDGRVKRVQTLRSSGSRQVDQAVVDAVYQWRAEGEELAGAKPGTPEATVWLDFRIVL